MGGMSAQIREQVSSVISGAQRAVAGGSTPIAKKDAAAAWAVAGAVVLVVSLFLAAVGGLVLGFVAAAILSAAAILAVLVLTNTPESFKRQIAEIKQNMSNFKNWLNTWKEDKGAAFISMVPKKAQQ